MKEKLAAARTAAKIRMATAGAAARVRLAAFRVWAAGRPAWVATRWPSRTWATRGLLTGIVGAWVALALIGTLVLTVTGGGAAASATPQLAAASPSTGASPSGTALSSASSTSEVWSSPTPDPLIKFPAVLASIECEAQALPPPVARNGRLYVACDGDKKIVAIDLATGKAATTYNIERKVDVGPCVMACVMPDIGLMRMDVDRHYLWLGWADPKVQAVGLSSRRVASTYEDSSLVGAGPGGMWGQDSSGFVNLETSSGGYDDGCGGCTSQVWWQDAKPACGSIWAWAGGRIGRADPAGSTEMIWETTVDGSIVDVIQAGSNCWALERSAAGDYRLLHLGNGCADLATREFRTAPFTLGATYWGLAGDFSDGDPQVRGMSWLGIRQIDIFDADFGKAPGVVPAGGFVWALTPGAHTIVAAGGQVWAGVGTEFDRFDIPLDPIPTKPFPAASKCPAASPTIDESALPSASPSASPSPASPSSPSPAPSASPSPSPSPSPSASSTATV